MAASNLQVGLERAYKDWRGEKIEVEKLIEETLAAYAALNEQRARAERLDELIKSAEMILMEISPSWDPAAVKPTYKGTRKLPFEIATVSRWTLDMLRKAKEPLRCRTMAERIMKDNGMSLDDRDTLTRLTNTIDSNLRQNLKKGLVIKTGEYPVLWSVRDFGDRPTA